MSLQTKIEGLTGITLGGSGTPSTAQALEYIKSGIKDIISRILISKPNEAVKFSTTEEKSHDPIVVKGGLISVMRYHDSATVLRSCTEIPAQLRYDASDTESLNYKSKYNPAFFQLNGKVDVVPAAAENNEMLVTQLVYPAPDDITSDEIASFPDEYEYLVILYAGMRTIHFTMASIDMPTDLGVFASISAPPSPPGSIPNAPNITSELIDVSGDISIASISDKDSVASIDAADLGTAPAYEYPSVFGAEQYTPDQIEVTSEITPGTAGTEGGQQRDWSDWFDIAGDYIEIEEDPELAQLQISKIKTSLDAYQGAMQNKLNIFNSANNEYQTEVKNKMTVLQSEVQKSQKEADLALAQASKNSDIQLQQAVKNKETDLQVSITNESNRVKTLVENYKQALSEYQFKLSRYEKELMQYQAEVTAEVQESTQGVQRVTTDIQKKGIEYNWYVEQYNRLKTEYDQAFGISNARTRRQAETPVPRGNRRRERE